jgi:2,3-dihydroxyphenylpropionate 1,2-dioxygenase
MSEIVLGIGASHTTLMTTGWDAVRHLDRANAFRDGLAQARNELIAAEPDLVVIVGSNHFRGFWLDLMPPFTIGVDVVTAVGEHGTPSGPQVTDSAAAQAIQEGLLGRNFDIAMSTDLEIDHGISHAIQYLVQAEVPVVPVVINVFGPPLPALGRCLALGTALRGAIHEIDGHRRVAVIGTGGLSHQIPFPDWREVDGPVEELLADSFRHGRGRWQDFEAKRRPLVVGAPPRLNEAFDGELLADLEAGRLGHFAARCSDAELVAAAGNGGNEIRAWLVMAAALDHHPGQTLAYAPMPEWLTGMAVAVIDPSTRTGIPASEE